MKTTTVPAQVTTVEDKIAGNLNLAQMLLLASSVFVGFALYIVIPPNMKFSIVKIILCLVVMLILASLSIRVRGRILALWIGTILRYNLRPRYYIFNKNDVYLRGSEQTSKDETVKIKKPRTETQAKKPLLEMPMTKLVQLEAAMADPLSRLAFETNKKGGLHVRITEIK